MVNLKGLKKGDKFAYASDPDELWTIHDIVYDGSRDLKLLSRCHPSSHVVRQDLLRNRPVAISYADGWQDFRYDGTIRDSNDDDDFIIVKVIRIKQSYLKPKKTGLKKMLEVQHVKA